MAEDRGGTQARALKPRLAAYLQFRHEVSSRQLTRRDGKLSVVVSELFLLPSPLMTVLYMPGAREQDRLRNTGLQWFSYRSVPYNVHFSAKADGIPY